MWTVTLKLTLALPLLIGMAGCARERPALPDWEDAGAFSGSGSRAVPEKWWRAFDDPSLNRQVQQALRENFSLAAAWQRLRAAEAIAARETAGFYPRLEGSLGGELQGGQMPGGLDGNGGSRSNQELNLDLSAGYEVDLWGRIQSRAAAEAFRARATYADYRAAALSLSAEVARTWFELIEARDQSALLDRQVETNEKVLRLLRARFGSGQIRGTDILRQQQLIEATREQRLVQQARAKVLEHQLAVLRGELPQNANVPGGGRLPTLPPPPATGLPAELVQRRPDIQQALARVKAADRDLAAAIAAQYPRLTLDTGLSSDGETPADLFDNWLRTLAGNLVGPIFDAGRRSAEADRTEAVLRERIAQYGQEVLTAFREVEDALARERRQRLRITSLRQQVELAAQTVEQLQLQYLNGVSDYIDVLTALTEEQQLRRDLLTARRALVEFRVALYRALAGGFTTPRETTR